MVLGGMGNPIGGVSAWERATVATATFTGTAAPLTETVLGVTVQAAAAGAPLHVKFTL